VAALRKENQVSLAQSILNGDTTPMGQRADEMCRMLQNLSRDTLNAVVIDREQDIIRVSPASFPQNQFRVQVLFDNPTETSRINRPLSPVASSLLKLLTDTMPETKITQAGGLVDVIEIGAGTTTSRLLLDPYLGIMNGEVL
jgi:hypothetical protein